MTVTAVAARLNVSKQAISRRVAKFVGEGSLQTRQDGRRLLIHVPTFDALCAARHDPAQDLRNRSQRKAGGSTHGLPGLGDDIAGDSATDLPPGSRQQLTARRRASGEDSYDAAKAREINARASMAEMELARRRGELCEAAEVSAAATAVADVIVNEIGLFEARASQIYAAGRTGGEAAVQTVIRELCGLAKSNIVRRMSEMADSLAPSPSQQMS